jgi:type III secretory pathway component EscU
VKVKVEPFSLFGDLIGSSLTRLLHFLSIQSADRPHMFMFKDRIHRLCKDVLMNVILLARRVVQLILLEHILQGFFN